MSASLISFVRIVARAVVFAVGLPLWLTAFPAIAAGGLDDYDGDNLWLPYIGTALLLGIPLMVGWFVVTEIWGTIRG